MLFGNSTVLPSFSMFINGLMVKRVCVCKFLGIFIDEGLTWRNHVQYVYIKLAKSVSMIKVASFHMSRDILTSMFHSFVLPYLRYDILILENIYFCILPAPY